MPKESLKKISITNQKGGVGKTTTSVNLAASLAAAGYKTLLVDLDPQGNASSGLGIDRFVSKTVYDVLIGAISLNEAIQDSPIELLKVIPANQNLIGAEVELINAISREKKLKNALKELPDDFDFVIFDCAPSLGLLTINAFTASDSIMIPLQCEYYAMEGLGQLLNTYQIVKEDLNEDLQIEGILLTMFDPRNKLTHEVVKEMKSHFPEQLYEAKIPRNVKLSEAPSFGKPVLIYDMESKGCRAYMDVASELLVRSGLSAPDWSAYIAEQRDAQKQALAEAASSEQAEQDAVVAAQNVEVEVKADEPAELPVEENVLSSELEQVMTSEERLQPNTTEQKLESVTEEVVTQEHSENEPTENEFVAEAANADAVETIALENQLRAETQQEVANEVASETSPLPTEEKEETEEWKRPITVKSSTEVSSETSTQV